jgi:AraC-like DNA-binding protein
MKIYTDLSFSFYLSLFCWLHLWFFAAVLWIKKRHSYSNRLLALFLFCFSFIHVQHVLLQSGILSYIPLFDPICGIVLSVLGPLFYFYVRSLTGYEIKRADFWHLLICLPGLFHLVFLLFTKNMTELSGYYYLDQDKTSRYTTINTLLLVGMLGYFIIYLLISARTISHYLRTVKQEYSIIETIRLKWLKELIWLLAIFSFLLSPIVLYIANAAVSSLVLGYFSTFIYFIIVYKSLSTSVLFTADLTKFSAPIPTEKPKYSNSVHSVERILEQGKLVEDFLANDGLLYEESLSLKQMADKLEIPPYVLSEIINRYFDKSFFDLINSARIERAKTQLMCLDSSNITIEGVGYNCGFGSKAAFYRAFKKSTGLTPKAYLKEQAKVMVQ